MTLKVLHSTTTNSGNYDYRTTRIFKFDDDKNPKTFKIKYGNRNGSQDLDCYIMDSSGVFQLVLTKYDLGFDFVSYVASDDDKKKNCDKALKLAENIIVKIYQ